MEQFFHALQVQAGDQVLDQTHRMMQEAWEPLKRGAIKTIMAGAVTCYASAPSIAIAKEVIRFDISAVYSTQENEGPSIASLNLSATGTAASGDLLLRSGYTQLEIDTHHIEYPKYPRSWLEGMVSKPAPKYVQLFT